VDVEESVTEEKTWKIESGIHREGHHNDFDDDDCDLEVEESLVSFVS
jgi:hypothetical protein